MVPPPLLTDEDDTPLPVALPVLENRVRVALLALALFLTAVFAVALWLNPYDDEGQPRRMETHRQIGLPPCTFYSVTGLPCPSCGMTTSFALLVRGDVWNSLRANAVGTLLALYGLVLIPWSLLSVWRRQLVWVRTLETALIRSIIVFMLLLLLRWGVVVAVDQLGRRLSPGFWNSLGLGG
jgi:hypothetical protein